MLGGPFFRAAQEGLHRGGSATFSAPVALCDDPVPRLLVSVVAVAAYLRPPGPEKENVLLPGSGSELCAACTVAWKPKTAGIWLIHTMNALG